MAKTAKSEFFTSRTHAEILRGDRVVDRRYNVNKATFEAIRKAYPKRDGFTVIRFKEKRPTRAPKKRTFKRNPGSMVDLTKTVVVFESSKGLQKRTVRGRVAADKLYKKLKASGAAYTTIEGYTKPSLNIRKAKSKKRLFARNPVRNKPAYMIVGQTENGKEYYFNGPGFGSDDSVVKYFDSENAARAKMRSLKNQLPPTIRYVFVHPA